MNRRTRADTTVDTAIKPGIEPAEENYSAERSEGMIRLVHPAPATVTVRLLSHEPSRSELRWSFHLLFLLFGAGLLAMMGCASTSYVSRQSGTLPDGFPNHSLSEVLSTLPAYPPELDRVFVEAQIAISSPEEKGRFTAKISYHRPDSMIARIGFPLGIEGARVLMAGDSAYVYDRIEKVLYTGSPERITAVLPQAVAGTQLIETATGFLTPDAGRSWSLSSDSLFYFIHSEDQTIRYLIDPSLWRVVGYRLSNSSGTIVEQRTYMDFDLINNILIPRRMVFSRPQEDTRLSMAIRRIDMDPSRLTFDLGVKEGVERIYLGE